MFPMSQLELLRRCSSATMVIVYGSGEGRSNKDILDAIYPFAQAAGLEPKVNILPPRQFDVEATSLIAEAKAGNRLGHDGSLQCGH